MTEKTEASDQPEKSAEELEFHDRTEVESRHLGIAGRGIPVLPGLIQAGRWLPFYPS